MIDAIELALQYGPIGILGFIIVFLVLIHEKKDGRIVRNLKKNFDKIEALEKKDIESDGRFDVIDTKLENLQTNMTAVGADVKTILNSFVSKGIG